MNILHMKYAVEVARLGSLNKAAETLMIAQPNISRSIKELEADLGITIFQRSAKGMVLTPDGEEFMNYARDILHRIEKIEQSYRDGSHKKRKLSISVPRACYISAALAEFSKNIGDAPLEIYYKETNSKKALKKLLETNAILVSFVTRRNTISITRISLKRKGLNGSLWQSFLPCFL